MAMDMILMFAIIVAIAAAGIAFAMAALLELGERLEEHLPGLPPPTIREGVSAVFAGHEPVSGQSFEGICHGFRIALQESHHRTRRESIPQALSLVPVADLQNLFGLRQPSERCAS
jgi:hypothetical protein